VQMGAGNRGAAHRLYDGRIHIPLNIIQDYFQGKEYPCSVTAQLFCNGQLVGDALAARVVQYRKHKKPNHFNYWLTGMQKTLSRFNDVRQQGVTWDSARERFVVQLLAAGTVENGA